jgi:hypothetical protein
MSKKGLEKESKERKKDSMLSTKRSRRDSTPKLRPPSLKRRILALLPFRSSEIMPFRRDSLNYSITHPLSHPFLKEKNQTQKILSLPMSFQILPMAPLLSRTKSMNPEQAS